MGVGGRGNPSAEWLGRRLDFPWLIVGLTRHVLYAILCIDKVNTILQDGRIRIISARRATREEESFYVQ